jgi:hypothetical protein
MSGEWVEQIAGARMQVDQRFQDRIVDSEFTNQQWGLIMSAVEFEIRDPETPSEAELVANTDRVEQILPEVEDIPQGMGGPPGGPSGGRSGGLLSRLKQLLSGGDSDEVDQDRLDAATTLADEYVVELQTFLEDEGQWAPLCRQAAGDDAG